MALAAAQHHSAPKSAGPVSHNVLRNQNTAREGTEFYAMSEDSDVVGGGRPPSLVDVRPQERVQQRTVEQIVDPVPLVPLLHDVVPQMVEQLVDILAPLRSSHLEVWSFFRESHEAGGSDDDRVSSSHR